MNAVEGNAMKECCTVDNQTQATADGQLNAKVNVLVCNTCGHQETFVYKETHPDNALFSYCRLVESRIRLNLPVFSDQQNRNVCPQ